MGNQPAARKGDSAICPAGGADPIVQGCPTVLIGGLPAARMTDKCAHGGSVALGFSRVLIGTPPVDAAGNAIVVPPECAFLKKFGKEGTGGRLDRLRDSHSTSAPVPVNHTIPGDTTTTPMLKREVVVRGHKVTVYEPVNGAPAGQWLPSSDTTAKGLATLSDQQLRNIKEVYIVPHPRTDMPSAVADYHDGKIRYFPRSEPHPQSDIDWALHIHAAARVSFLQALVSLGQDNQIIAATGAAEIQAAASPGQVIDLSRSR